MRSKYPTQKKPEQILFNKNIYTIPQTKVVHWNYVVEAEKKDNHVYRDQLSNMVGTYNRLGTEDQKFTTETRIMLAQVYTKAEPYYSFKPLVNFTSYPCTDTPSRNRLAKTCNLVELPADYGVMDYATTQQNDYRNPFPSVAQPLTMASPPWLMNRVICSDLTQNYGTAPPHGFYQCLDTHTPIGHIRQMRLRRRQSFDPATCIQNFPNITKPFDTNENKTGEKH